MTATRKPQPTTEKIGAVLETLEDVINDDIYSIVVGGIEEDDACKYLTGALMVRIADAKFELGAIGEEGLMHPDGQVTQFDE